MAQGKKISELNEVSSVTDNDEFLFVDKEGSGANSGVGGKTAKIKFSDLKSAIGAGSTGAKGASGDKGMKGEPGPRGLDGEGTQYWTQSPSDGDAVYYDAGNVGVGTTDPSAKVHINAGLPTGTVNTVGPFRVDASTGSSESASFEVEVRNTTDGGQYASIQSYNSNTSSGLNAVPLKIQRNGGDLHVGGDVGIGTDSPQARLQVPQGSSTIGGIDLTKSCILVGNATDGIGFDNNEIVKRQGTNGGSLNIASQGINADIKLKTGARESDNVSHTRMIIDSNGYVGIGTISPNRKLVVEDVSETEFVDIPASSGVTLTLNSDTITSVSGSDNFASTVESGDSLYFYSLIDATLVLFSGAVLNVVDNNTIQLKRTYNVNNSRDIFTHLGEGNSTINASVKRLPRENVKFTSENGSTYKFGNGMSISTDNSLGTSSLLSLRTSGDDISNVPVMHICTTIQKEFVIILIILHIIMVEIVYLTDIFGIICV